MENRQYEHDSLNQKDLFQEYIDSLPEEDEETKKTEEPKAASPGVSKQVEEDLLDYKRRGYDSVGSHTSRRASLRRNRRPPATALALLIGGAALSIIGVTGVLIARNTYAEPVYYEEEPYAIEYEDPWEDAYMQMSGTLASPEVIVDGHYVSLPVKVSDFMQEDWRIRSSAFSEAAETVGADPVTLRVETDYGYNVGEINVVSPTGEEVAVEDALITGISFDSVDTWTELNHGISIGSGSWGIEEALNEDGVEWVKRGGSDGSRYVAEAGTENEYGYDEYVLRFELQDDYIERIVMQLSQGE